MKKNNISFPVIICILFVFSFVSTALPQVGSRNSAPEVEKLAQNADQFGPLVEPPKPPQQQTPPRPQPQIQPHPQPQLQPQAPQQPQAPPQPQMPPQPPAQAQQAKSSPTVSFFFDDADIFEVAQTIFADVLKVNYIIDPRVKGRVNFRTVTPIPKDQVLPVMNIIFRLNGIGFVEENGLYRIVPLEEVPQELVYSQIGKPPSQVAIEMFTFKNLDLKESMPDIENALGLHIKGGTVRILPLYRLNALIVIASSKVQLGYIKEWIETFDDMFAVVRPKIFVYPLQNGKADHVASILQSILGGGSGSTSTPTPRVTQPKPTTESKRGPSLQTPASSAAPVGASVSISGGGGFVSPLTRIFADDITNSLIILTTPADYKFLEETISKIDIQPRQVLIEAVVAKVVLNDNLSLGMSWNLNTDFRLSGIRPFTRPVDLNGTAYSVPKGGDLSPDKISNGFTFVATDPTGNVRAKLVADLEHSKGKVLAAPNILVADNREAKIQVGQQVPLATSSTSYVTTTETTGTIPLTSTVQYQDIGIILKVKPQINDSGLVSLELTQELSDISATQTQIAGQSYSAIDKTEATTNLVAQDGETIVIGGLIREDTTKTKNGIPILSSIPFIGNLFSFTSDIATRTEIVILLTPHVIRNQREARDVSTDFVNKYKNAAQDKEINQFLDERGRNKVNDKNKDNGNKTK